MINLRIKKAGNEGGDFDKALFKVILKDAND